MEWAISCEKMSMYLRCLSLLKTVFMSFFIFPSLYELIRQCGAFGKSRFCMKITSFSLRSWRCTVGLDRTRLVTDAWSPQTVVFFLIVKQQWEQWWQKRHSQKKKKKEENLTKMEWSCVISHARQGNKFFEAHRVMCRTLFTTVLTIVWGYDVEGIAPN